MHVRRIRPDEGALLRRVRLEALADAPDAFGSTHAQALAYSDDAWQSRAEVCAGSDTDAIFFTEHAGSVVGMAGGHVAPDDATPTLISMWISPDARGLGGGEALVEAVVGWCRGIGANCVQLWVTETNAPAIALYERTGFTATGETQPLPSNPALMERRMSRTL